ncbi:MAG: carboxypeptidase-like regulatory domain-containing protein, partial [marine benthic group bacterium]|nr:carboxypeptidase-like regulatory domain-containing protein [Gemmatimonadota bacterium]
MGPLEVDFSITWEGIVTSAAGSPIEGAIVEMFFENTDGTARAIHDSRAYTDAEGRYFIKKYVCPAYSYLEASCAQCRASQRVYASCEPKAQRIDFVLGAAA